jgi:hypothetical protein
VSRVTLTPVNYTRTGIVYPATPAPSADGTTWGSNTGVQFVNNGYVHLWYYNGVTATSANLLIGKQVEGQTFPANTLPVTIGASTTGAIGGLSQSDFLQLDGSGMTYIDFANTTTLFVRLYQLIPVP